MLKVKLTCAIAMIAALSAASVAQASIRTIAVGDTVTIRYSGFDYRTGSGGEFQLGKVNNPNANANYFHTFCAETGEHLGGSNQQYYVQSLSLVSNAQGGVLTSAAAKLYRDYYDGIAARGYGYQSVNGSGQQQSGVSTAFALGGSGVNFNINGNAATRAASGSAIQTALWKMLGYGGSLSGDALTLYNWYTTTYNNNSFGYFGVRIANLVYANDHSLRTQDQFVVVPEPGSLAIWGLVGLGCTLAAGRRRRLA